MAGISKNVATENNFSRRVTTLFPGLLRLAEFTNRKILRRAGIKIVGADALGFSKEWPDRLIYFERLLSLIKDAKGDIVECGVAGGASLAIFLTLNRNSPVKRHIWGFDSFEGLPTPGDKDTGLKSIGKRGMFSDAIERKVLLDLRAIAIDENSVRDQVTLVKGWFSDTLSKYTGSIALLHLDADLYESTKCALENLWPKVVAGGIIALDEYQDSEKWPGEKKAVDEYFAQPILNREAIMQKDPFCNRYYIMKK